jgi:HD-GYP domain-containing protein (c-di-GMP phosphodiesterase class II)
MMRHVELGSMMIERLVRDFNLATVAGIGILRNVVSGHHEFLDGSGYPKGLKAEQIPLEARIVTVADIFDALTSKRTYKDAWDVGEAFAELDQMVAGGKLDADCVRALREGSADIVRIISRYNEPEEIIPPAC